MATFLTADWHLGENRMVIMGRPFKTPEEMLEVLVERHNSLVTPEDVVIHLGDVCNRESPNCLEHVARFNGKKILIRGNHDTPLQDKDLLKYFELIVPEGDGIKLDLPFPAYATHYPTRGRPDRFNLVGHIHSAWKVQKNMLNVGVDVHHFYPVPLDRVPFYLSAIAEFYDQDVWCADNDINRQHNGRGKAGSYFQWLNAPRMWDLTTGQAI